MKQQENNEIDSLLRSWSGGRATTPASIGGASATDHLDADELNAYVEGAVPASTRARYSSHLVDCDGCRKLVSQLSIAAGKPAGQPAVELQRGAWWKSLSAIFAPAVLKFALPALALFVVGTIFFVSRQNRETQLAQSSDQQRYNAQSGGSPPAVSNGPVASPAEPAGRTTATSEPTAEFAKNDSSAQRAQNAAPATSTTAASPAGNEKKPVSTKESEPAQPTEEREAKAKDQPAAPAPPPEQPKPASNSVNVVPKDTAASSVGGATAADKTERKRAPARRADDANASTDEAAKGRDEDTRKQKRLDALAMSGRREVETRTVGGHTFHHQNGQWIDASVKSGMAMTSVKRNSEQYRALVADEPEIDTIAKELSGQIVLVWKGRGYLIK